MASMNWIKMRDDLHEDPAVLRMAGELQVRPETIVGYLHRFWCWVGRNTSDGQIPDIVLAEVEQVLGLPTFLQRLCNVGWLEFIEVAGGRGQMIIPKFEEHLSQSAKHRALEARRKREQRAKKVGHCPKKSGTREEKRREEKSINKESKPKKVFPPTLEQIREFCRERSNSVPPEAFFDYYETQGWQLANGRKMKNWQAAVRQWERRESKPKQDADREKAFRVAAREKQQAEFRRARAQALAERGQG